MGLKKRVEELSEENSQKNKLRHTSISGNKDFQMLVNECDRYIFENKNFDTGVDDIYSELIEETLRMIDLNDEARRAFK